MEAVSIDPVLELEFLLTRLRVVPAQDPDDLGNLSIPSSPEYMWG